MVHWHKDLLVWRSLIVLNEECIVDKFGDFGHNLTIVNLNVGLNGEELQEGLDLVNNFFRNLFLYLDALWG
jgi:hypothetical protein